MRIFYVSVGSIISIRFDNSGSALSAVGYCSLRNSNNTASIATKRISEMFSEAKVSGSYKYYNAFCGPYGFVQF